MFDPWSRKKNRGHFFPGKHSRNAALQKQLILIICLENESAKLTWAFAIKAFTEVI
jgi:hypothetical protein